MVVVSPTGRLHDARKGIAGRNEPHAGRPHGRYGRHGRLGAAHRGDQVSDYLRAWRARQRARGRCVACLARAELGRKMCALHLYKARVNKARRVGKPLPEMVK